MQLNRSTVIKICHVKPREGRTGLAGQPQNPIGSILSPHRIDGP